MAKIKICGLFRDDDIDYVNEVRPDYIGFVFAKSRRQVTMDTARAMRGRLDNAIASVGVFVNAAIGEIERAYREGVIGLAQLHGDEDEPYIRELKNRCGVPVIKAVRVDTTGDILAWQCSAADYLLLDNGTGGTGKVFDWRLIPKTEKPFFLAGGIHSGNIGGALRLRPYGLDVSSGVETGGCKDRDKIARLVRSVREGS